MSRPGGDSQPLRISVLSQIDPASPRTNSIADLRLCAGLAAQGHGVELVVPATTESRPSDGELFDTYGLEPTFEVRYLTAARSNHGGRRATAALLCRHLVEAVRRKGPSVVISRDAKLLLPYLAMAGTRARSVVTAPWLHEFQNRRLERLACSRSTCILATNSAILRDLAEREVSNSASFVTGNPVPRERVEFGRTFSKADARSRLGLDLRRPVIAYTGKLYLGMRELEYLLAVAPRLSDCLFLFTGGQPPVVEALRERLREAQISNVRLAGMLSLPEETRFYQQAADVLVSYYSTEDHAFARHNLPNKLAEYMTTGNAIVVADFPAVRDLLNPANSILVRPDDVNALADALVSVIRSPDKAASLADRARSDIATRTTESVGAELSAFLAQV